MLRLETRWDKTFKRDESITHKKVQYENDYGILLTADMYYKDDGLVKPAIVIGGPFGAVKEQASGRYAHALAAYGFITLAFDPSFTGESGGKRYCASIDINTEDFLAGVDYLSSLKSVDKNNISIIGICGHGGLALNAGIIDKRIKKIVTITMYDMARVNQNGYFDLENSRESREKRREYLSSIRTEDFLNGYNSLKGGVSDTIPEDAPQFVKDYYAYYKTERGYHARSLNSNEGFNKTADISYLNGRLLTYINELSTPVLMIHGSKAHSLYFSEDVYQKINAKKELLIIENASHVDLYDNDEYIPYNKIVDFLK